MNKKDYVPDYQMQKKIIYIILLHIKCGSVSSYVHTTASYKNKLLFTSLEGGTDILGIFTKQWTEQLGTYFLQGRLVMLGLDCRYSL